MNCDQTNKPSTAPFLLVLFNCIPTFHKPVMNTSQFSMNLDFLLNLANVLLVTSLLMTVCVCVSQIPSDARKKRKEKSKGKGKDTEGRQQSHVS